MAIEMTCPLCGITYSPTLEEIIAGPDTYRRCPGCRSGDELVGYVDGDQGAEVAAEKMDVGDLLDASPPDPEVLA